MSTFEKLAGEPLTICIDGAGGGGKSTLADALVEVTGVEDRQLIRGDWYFEPWPEGHDQQTSGFFNDGRFMTEVGAALNSGDSPIVREYDMKQDEFVTHTPPDMHRLIIVEGIKMLGLPVNWSFGIWVETPRETREQRFMERAVEARRSNITDPEVLRRNFNIWADDAEQYRQTVITEQRAHLFLQGNDSRERQLGVIALAFEAGYFSQKA